MKTSPMAILAMAGSAMALQQDCTGTAVDEGGNWFCGAVKALRYEGVGSSGSYDAITSMSEDGACGTAKKEYSGPLAPLNEDLSLHFRGPIELAEFAVYNLGSAKKRDVEEPTHEHVRRHGHGHGHNHQRLHKRTSKQDKRDMVVATINGQVVSWENNYFPGGAAPTAAPEAESEPAANNAAVVAADVKVPETEKAAPAEAPPAKPKPKSKTKTKSKPSTGGKAAGGDWSRVAYYNAKEGVTDNLVFLGNYGGSGSGVWSMGLGNSLSFLNAAANGGAKTAEALKSCLVPDNTEFSIWSAEKCDDSCGAVRDKQTAYKGFAGANKIFLATFRMPMSGKTGFNADMPAYWSLNGAIARAGQYSDCSCWATGCGEFDIYEVLAQGDKKCKSTLHLNNGAGSSDYFNRPTDEFITVATVFQDSGDISIRELPRLSSFKEGLSASEVADWVKGEAKTSIFQLAA